MKNLSCLFVLVLGLLSGYHKEGVPVDHVILDESLRKAYLTLNESNKRVRSQLLFDDGYSASDCDSYLKLMSTHDLVLSADGYLPKSEYLECDALKILTDSQIFSGKISMDAVGVALLNRLDLRSFPNSAGQLADDKSFTIAKLFPGSSSVSGPTVVVNAEDWALTVSVVAIVRADGDAEADWVVQVADESKSGTYRDYRTLLILNPESLSVIDAKMYPPKRNLGLIQ